MGRRCDKIRFYFSVFADKVQSFLLGVITALSFIALIISFGFMTYFLFIEFDLVKVVTNAIAICTFIHLNKSLQGR